MAIDPTQYMNQVTDLFDKYSLPKDPTPMERIQYVAYRIWNAIKSIFGASDWQKIQNDIRHTVFGLRTLTLQTLPQNARNMINGLFSDDTIKSLIEASLTVGLNMYKTARQTLDPTQFRALINDPSLLGNMINFQQVSNHSHRSFSTAF